MPQCLSEFTLFWSSSHHVAERQSVAVRRQTQSCVRGAVLLNLGESTYVGDSINGVTPRCLVYNGTSYLVGG